MLKAEYAVKAIHQHNIDRAIIFCRTKLDCDNLEKYFKSLSEYLILDMIEFIKYFEYLNRRRMVSNLFLNEEFSSSGRQYNPRDNPLSCVCLHGDRKPHERKSNYENFKQGQVKFLICTDVAARGLDISGLPFSNFVHN